MAVDHPTAAAALGISPSRLRHHVRLGDVTPHFSGTKPLYAITELQGFIEGLPTHPEYLPVVYMPDQRLSLRLPGWGYE